MASTSNKGKARKQEEQHVFLSDLDILQSRQNYRVHVIKATDRGNPLKKDFLAYIEPATDTSPEKKLPVALYQGVWHTQIHNRSKQKTHLHIRTHSRSTRLRRRSPHSNTTKRLRNRTRSARHHHPAQPNKHQRPLRTTYARHPTTVLQHRKERSLSKHHQHHYDHHPNNDSDGNSFRRRSTTPPH